MATYIAITALYDTKMLPIIGDKLTMISLCGLVILLVGIGVIFRSFKSNSEQFYIDGRNVICTMGSILLFTPIIIHYIFNIRF